MAAQTSIPPELSEKVNAFLKAQNVTVAERLGEGALGWVMAGKEGVNELAVKISKHSIQDLPDKTGSEWDRGPDVWSISRTSPLLMANRGGWLVDVGGKSHLVTLWDRAQSHVTMPSPSPFARTEALRILEPIAKAVDYLNTNGFLHRDLKLENFFRFGDGTIRLGDFGSAVCIKTRPRSDQTAVHGNWETGSPGQLHGQIDDSCDRYALAIVYIQMITGRYLFEEITDGLAKRNAKENEAEIMHHLERAGVSTEERQILAAVLAPAAHQRAFRSAERLWHRLCSIDTGEPSDHTEIDVLPTVDVNQELVQAAIGLADLSPYKRLTDELETLGLFQKKQLAYESLRAVQLVLVHLGLLTDALNGPPVEGWHFAHLTRNLYYIQRSLETRLQQASSWTDYQALVLPINQKLDRFLENVARVAGGRWPKAAVVSTPLDLTSGLAAAEAVMKPQEQEAHFRSLIADIRSEAKQWLTGCTDFLAQHCRLLGASSR